MAVEHLREGTSIVSSGSVPGISRPLWLRFYTATKAAVNGPTSVFAAAVAPDEIGNTAVLLASGDTLRAADKIGPCPAYAGLAARRFPLTRSPSMLIDPAPKAATWSRPPTMATFLRKWIIWFWSAKLL